MHPHLTYLHALEHARDLRHDADARRSAAAAHTTGDRTQISRRIQPTASRPRWRLGLRTA